MAVKISIFLTLGLLNGAFSLSQEACNSLDNLINNSDSYFVGNCTKDAACARIMCESLQLTFDLCEEPPRAHLASQEFGLNVTIDSNDTISTLSHGNFSITFSPFSVGVYFELSSVVSGRGETIQRTFFARTAIIMECGGKESVSTIASSQNTTGTGTNGSSIFCMPSLLVMLLCSTMTLALSSSLTD